MKRLLSRALVALPAGAVGLAVAAVAPPSFAATAASASVQGVGAVFVQTDDLQHNGIVAFTRGADGHLTRVGEVPTGGRGGVERDVPLDSLASQDSLTYDAAHHLLFAVNAGSNTVTSFPVTGAHLTRVQTVPSGGVFPVSVSAGPQPAVRAERRRVGQRHRLPDQPLGPADALPGACRDLGLNNEARPEFITAPADIAQTPDGDHVIVTTKANNTSTSSTWTTAGSPLR